MRKLFLLSQIFTLFLFVSCKQNSESKSLQFLSALNNYQKDSLDKMISKDFLLYRNYAHDTNDRKDFLERYLDHSKNLNGKFVLKRVMIKDTNPIEFLVASQSDPITYLDIVSPDLIMKIYFENGKIQSVGLDSTENYKDYTRTVSLGFTGFDKWLDEHHKTNAATLFSDTNGLLLKRLKEYTHK